MEVILRADDQKKEIFSFDTDDYKLVADGVCEASEIAYIYSEDPSVWVDGQAGVPNVKMDRYEYILEAIADKPFNLNFDSILDYGDVIDDGKGVYGWRTWYKVQGGTEETTYQSYIQLLPSGYNRLSGRTYDWFDGIKIQNAQYPVLESVDLNWNFGYVHASLLTANTVTLPSFAVFDDSIVSLVGIGRQTGDYIISKFYGASVRFWIGMHEEKTRVKYRLWRKRLIDGAAATAELNPGGGGGGFL